MNAREHENKRFEATLRHRQRRDMKQFAENLRGCDSTMRCWRIVAGRHFCVQAASPASLASI
jgi:hypothetical protein